MAQPETLDALLEDSFSDADLEEGEMTEEERMDVDVVDGRSIDAEEGEILLDEPPSSALHGEAVESTAVDFSEVNNHQVNGESGLSRDPGRPPRQKKRNKRRSGKRAKSVDVAQFVRETCTRLQEKKYPLVWAAVKQLGVDGVKNLLKEVDVIERVGGQMTHDGKRRRTPGGVMWNILRGRVQPDVYKEIMSKGNEVQRQRDKDRKTKEPLKRSRMDVDEPGNNKRQKLATKDEDMSGSVAAGKPVNQSRKVLRPAKDLSDVIDFPQKDNSSLPTIHLQKAWVEGIKKKETADEAAAVSVPSTGTDPDILKDGTAKPVSVFERLRVPVEYGDLVTEAKASLLSRRQMAPLEYSDLVEGALGDLGRQDAEQNCT